MPGGRWEGVCVGGGGGGGGEGGTSRISLPADE